MFNSLKTTDNPLNSQIEDANLNELNPNFEFNKFKMGIYDIQNEAEQLINKGDYLANIKENRFPVDVFPSLFQDLINECNGSLNFPTDYTGASIISAVSTAIGKSAKVKVKTKWYEFPSLYVAIIGNAGANKSHPLDLAFKPFEDIDSAIINIFKEEYKLYTDYQSLGKEAKKVTHPPLMPILVKTVLHNFTPEILYKRLNENERGCTVASEELATFLQGMNNYSKGDQSSVYLSFWSNKATSVDRVSLPEPLWLPQPFLNIIGSLQPRVLQKLFPSSKTDNGFLQRFLFAYPANTEKQPINDFEINERLIQKYNDWIKNYIINCPIKIDIETQSPSPKIYSWSEDAKNHFYKWQKENTASVNNNSESLKGEILSKFDIHFVRLSLILQIMEDYNTDKISLKAVQGAEKLCTYFLSNAMKVLEILETSSPSNNLPQNKLSFFTDLPQQFTTSEANTIGKNLGLNIKAVQRLLNDTTLFDWIAHGKYSKKK